MNPASLLTPNQRAAIASVTTLGLLLLAFGIVVVIMDVANVEKDCTSSGYCIQGDADTRGFFIIAYGLIIAIAAAVARSVLKKANQPENQVHPQVRFATDPSAPSQGFTAAGQHPRPGAYEPPTQQQ